MSRPAVLFSSSSHQAQLYKWLLEVSQQPKSKKHSNLNAAARRDLPRVHAICNYPSNISSVYRCQRYLSELAACQTEMNSIKWPANKPHFNHNIFHHNKCFNQSQLNHLCISTDWFLFWYVSWSSYSPNKMTLS